MHMPDAPAPGPHFHSAFGGVLRSAIALPELPRADAAGPRADWTFDVVERLEPARDARECGREQLAEGVSVTLVRHALGARVSYDDTGTFDVDAGGRAIRWERRDGVSDEAVRTDLISRVLATALHVAGMPVLHGSGVVAEGRALAFLAPKLHGKSTLATALVRAGALLLSDDALPVEAGAPPRARPGIHSVRLWNDAAARLAPDADHMALGTKRLLRELPSGSLARSAAPLAAIYLLAPAPAGATEPVTRHRIATVPAALAIVRHAKLGELLAGSEAPSMLERAAAIAGAVPVYALRVARDLDRVGAAAERILDWHASAASAGAA
jgi:hypothetical protein